METALGLAFVLPILGLLAMIVMPRDWQNVPGWLITSYLVIPGALIVISVVIYFPPLLFGALLFAGFAAGRK